ncbi:bifunctional DNA-formamidopyrimidine glycosylase/DNA-(apurinic or apyrimidinic site) lyase [Hahella ganghwensis]|uniref:bifunctional DNA-formamidopyrimidine glycosylase/DNA-(apurinic or apyrimidinic site) lyase n=1 Tax=Hahella ganghwensis TaxID=286420 RepID=UPI00036CF092|nr:bifunctional DNA-formamidopyrimidine glycosylase/DNA-(apurinic or apyrimidinic site) lyase [Hahella ganghwensis]
MPELPEVETTRKGIEPHIINKKIREVRVYQPHLRWPVPNNLNEQLSGLKVLAVERRAKYILIRFLSCSLIIHLGMSGSLRILNDNEPKLKHDHIDVDFTDGTRLRFNDPRRFGCFLPITGQTDSSHPLLANLGPEPLGESFNGDYLHRLSRGRRSSIKTFVMDQAIVVGVGNIYANEALFKAGISPARAAGQISLKRYRVLAEEIKTVLKAAINMGGTTLRDFVGGDGKPGYFQQTLMVYGRGGEPCLTCKKILKEIRLGQRSTVYCTNCQK